MNEKFRSLQFPKFGLDVSTPAFDQRPGTAPLAINVRAYDSVTDRLRGGSRCGLTPFFGAGSTIQVSGFNRIQSLSSIVTADQRNTFQNQFVTLTVRMNYSETDHPPARNAPQVETPFDWFTETSPTFPGVTGVLSPPDGGGTGQGTCSFKISTDGVNVTLVATFVSVGFPGPYFFITPSVRTLQQTNANFFNPAISQLTSDFTVLGGPGFSFIGNIFFNVFFPGP